MAAPNVVLRFLRFIEPLRGKNRWGRRTKFYARRLFTQIAIARLISSTKATARARKAGGRPLQVLRALRDVMITVRQRTKPTWRFLRWLAKKVPIISTLLAGYAIVRTVRHVRALIIAARGGPEDS